MTAVAQERTDTHTAQAADGYAIKVADLSVWYGRTRAVRQFSMNAPVGSIYGLVGPSGGGKSTVLRVLAGVLPPSDGTIVLLGHDVRANPAAARACVGFLPDSAGVYGSLSVAEYLDFYGSMFRLPVRLRRQASEELLELVGLGDRRDQPVGNLPRGMQQKLNLARCLMHDPPILLLDEPAAGLDARSRLELRDILSALAGFGKTVVISSHLLAELSEVCTHIGIMRGGALLMEGSVEDVVSRAFPHAHLRIRLLDPGDVDAARHMLSEQVAVVDIDESDPTTLLLPFAGTEKDMAALLSSFARHGLRVIEFGLQRPTLEEAILLFTDGESGE